MEKAYLARKRVQNNGKSDLTSRPAQPPICPECGSTKTWRDGIRKNGAGLVQRWICRNCGYRFSDPSLSNKKEEGHTLTCQICVSEVEAKNLAEVETRGKWAAGATETSDATVKGKIIEFLWWLQKQGYRPGTVRGRVGRISRLVKVGANIFDPEDVKETIARETRWNEGSKAQVVIAYSSFLQMLGETWNSPRYKAPEKLPFIPLQTEIDALINSCGRVMGCFLQGLKDTGADPGELAHLEWTDINHEAGSVTINHPVKGHNARVVPVSDALLGRLKAMPKKRGNRVFCSLTGLSSNFRYQRQRCAQKLSNPRILRIHFTTFRHWKGTMEYHRTQDSDHVRKILGHKYLSSTQVYINVEAAIFDSKSDEFITKVPKTIEEACSLIDIGFEYHCDWNDQKIFRKRK